jgi:hypothetical protein
VTPRAGETPTTRSPAAIDSVILESVRRSSAPRPRLAPTRIKGTNVVHARDYVEARYGLEGWASVAAELSKGSRDAVEAIVAIGWYPAQLHVDVLHAMHAALSARDADVVRHAARHAAEYDVTRIHRVLFRMLNPGLIFEKSGEIWSRFYDTGRWTFHRPTSYAVTATLRDFGIADPLYCVNLAGYFERMFELTGATDVRIRHPECAGAGAPHCRFEGTWR